MKNNLSHYPFNIQKKNSFLFNLASNFESNFFVKKKSIDNPVFLSGLARSGTTIVTDILNNTQRFSSFLYQDMPFYKTPILWNYLKKFFFQKEIKKIRREHGDNIFYNFHSPDAFEELIWSNHIEDYEDNFASVLSSDYSNENLINDLKKSMQKIIFLRGQNRYLSKGNYNLFRINFLTKEFQNAKFIILVRDPFQTALSLKKIDERFSAFGRTDKKFDKILNSLCHFEFGNNKKIPNFFQNKEIIKNCWINNEVFLGYLLFWKETYEFVYNSYLNSDVKKKIHIVNYDEFKKDHKKEIRKLFSFLGLEYDKSQNFDVNFTEDHQVSYEISSELKSNLYSLYNNIVNLN